MPTINDLRQQAVTIKNATQVGENTATRVGTTFETIADLLEGMGGVTNLSTIDIGSIDTLNTTGDMLVGTPNIYTLTKTIGANTFKVGTLFQFANNGRYDVAQVIVSQFIVDADGRIDTTSADQEVHIFYRLCKTMNGGSLPTPIGTWTTWTELGGSGGSGVTIDPYPTQNSGNAVSSGGMFERLQDVAPKVDISAIDDIDEYSDMLANVSPFYEVTKTLSGNVFRIGTLMEFANQGRYILYQILATDYVLNDDGTLDTTTSENGGLKLIWRMKQFSGNPPAGVTIGVWSAWSYLSGGGVQPDNEDIDLNANDQLQFANKAYDASAFSGLGRVYLRKNIVELNLTDKYFDGFVNDVLVQDVGTSSTPDAILFDTTRKMFVARVGLLYYVDWSSDEDYNPITRDVNWNYNGNFYRWNGEELVQWDKTINQLTQAMVNTANTIYHIQYDYDLNGQTINLPAGCVLEFEGGSLKNGTIVVNNTKIEGSPKILCDISGVLEEAYLTWFGIESDDTDADAGEVINRVESHVRKFIIPKGNWYIYTPCTLSCRKIEWLGEMYYVGEATDVRVVTITGIYTELQMSGSLICQSSAVNYTTANMTNIWGLVFKNMQFGYFRVGNINYFNVNVVVIGEGMGTCNNVFMLSLLRHANIGILITQKDIDGNVGWANENTFIGGKIGNLSSWNYTTCESHAVVAKKVFEDDNYARVNSLMFLKQNCEGLKVYPAFLFENVSNTTVSEIRIEGVDIFYKLIGQSYSNSFSNSFGFSTKDISEVTYSSTAAPLKFEYYGSCCKYFDLRDSSLVSDEGNVYISKGTLVGFMTRLQSIIQDITKTANGASFFGLSLDILSTASTNIRLRLRNTTGARKFVYLKAKDFHEGTSTTNQNAIITGTSLSYNNVYDYWKTGSDVSECKIVVRGGVKTLYIACSDVQSFSIEYNPSDVSINSNHPTSGTTEDRPTNFLYKGRKYFDTTKDEPVWWDGTKWVESKKPIYKILDVLLGNVLKSDHSDGTNWIGFSPIIVNTSNEHTTNNIPGYEPAGIILPYLNKGKYTIKVNASFRVYIAYYNSEYQRLEGVAPTSSVGKVYAWKTIFGGVWMMSNTYTTDEVVNIPEVENAAYVFVGIVTSGSAITTRFIIESTELQYRASDISVRTNGTTANRPTERWAGYEYFDTDLGKPIYWNGTVWVNATGTAV